MNKLLLKKILYFSLLIIIVDYLFGECMNYIYAHTEKGDFGRNNYICEEADQDILIFGSSRAIHHYNPETFERKLGMSCYNCGEDGMGIILSYGRYKLAQRKHQPKLIIYDIENSYDILQNDNSKYIGFLKPYYCVPGIDSLIWEIDYTERYKMLSKSYWYNSRWIDIMAQFCSKSNELARDYKYAPLQGTLYYDPARYVFASDEDCDKLKLDIWERFLNDCNKNSTQVIFVISPVYGERDNHILKPFLELIEKHKIPLFDHFSDPFFVGNKTYFADKMHLNSEGSVYFSDIIADEIYTYYNN